MLLSVVLAWYLSEYRQLHFALCLCLLWVATRMLLRGAAPTVCLQIHPVHLYLCTRGGGGGGGEGQGERGSMISSWMRLAQL